MAKIEITDFKGTAPVRAAQLLPMPYAQTSINAKLTDGNLTPMLAPELVYTFVTPYTTIYKHNDDWLGWNADVDVAPGPVTEDRLYITGDGDPKVRLNGGSTRSLALPPPASSPNVNFLGTIDPTNQESVTYAYTWVTDLGEESAPSPLSSIIQVTPGAAVRLSNFATPPAARGVNRIRIYRSQTGLSGATDLFFVSETAFPVTLVDHDSNMEPLQEPISTAGYTPPPANMAGIVSMPNGMMAAFSGREVLFCEPYLPYAWPESYRLTLNANVVGLVAFGSSLAVLTDASPVLMEGTHPDSMSQTQVEQDLPCLARRGIVDLGYAAAYPSADGVVLISNTGAKLVTRSLFSRKQWQAFQPSTLRAARYDGRYVFSYQDGPSRKVGMIDMLGQDVFFAATDDDAQDFVFNPQSADLLMLRGAGAVYQFDPNGATAPKTVTWRSRVFQMPSELPFGCAMVQGQPAVTGASLTMTVYADGVPVGTVTDWNTVTRLSPGRARKWEIQVVTNGIVEAIVVAGTPAEIMAQ